MQRFQWMGLYVVLVVAALASLIAVVAAVRVPMAQ